MCAILALSHFGLLRLLVLILLMGKVPKKILQGEWMSDDVASAALPRPRLHGRVATANLPRKCGAVSPEMLSLIVSASHLHYFVAPGTPLAFQPLCISKTGSDFSWLESCYGAIRHVTHFIGRRGVVLTDMLRLSSLSAGLLAQPSSLEKVKRLL